MVKVEKLSGVKISDNYYQPVIEMLVKEVLRTQPEFVLEDAVNQIVSQVTQKPENEVGKPLAISTAKVVYRGLKYRRILKIEGQTLRKMPFRYVNGLPRCSVEVAVDEKTGKEYRGIVVFGKNKEDFVMVEGEFVPEFYFQKVLPVIREAGHRFYVINQKIKQIKAEWNGEEEFKI
jgi:hypothetical protein